MTQWIRTPEELRALGDGLVTCSALALDSESDSLYHYTEKVCLVQVVSDRGHRCLIDTLLLRDLSPLAPALADPAIVKVLHGADYDVTTMKRDFGLGFATVFDTMIAGRFLGRAEVGLQAMLRSELGVEISKSSQTDDWSIRPLTPVRERYAIADVDHLLPLRRRLVVELEALSRLSWVEEECAAVAALEAGRRGRDPDAWQKIKGARKLSPRNLAVLRDLCLWREARAQDLDRPPFKVLSNDTLLELAESAPRTEALIASWRGLSQALKSRAAELRAVIETALDSPKDQWPRLPAIARPNVPEAIRRRVDALKAWRARTAEALGLDVSLVLPQRLVDRVAEVQPKDVADLESIDGLRQWRIRSFGTDLVAAIRRL